VTASAEDRGLVDLVVSCVRATLLVVSVALFVALIAVAAWGWASAGESSGAVRALGFTGVALSFASYMLGVQQPRVVDAILRRHEQSVRGR